MRTKFSAFFSDLAQRSKTPNLKTSRICKQGAVPTDETMQTTGGFDHLNAGSQPQMVSISQNNLRV